MKKLILLFGLMASLQLYSQNLNFDLLNYTWNTTPPTFTPTEEDKKAGTVFVFMNKTTEYIFDKKGEGVLLYYVSHNLRYINDDKSIEENNKIYVSTNSQQNLLYVKTRVIDHKQKVLFEATEKDFIQVEEEDQKYNMIALKGLTKGVLVETIIGYKLNAELYGEETFQTNALIKKAEYMLITPDQLKFNNKIYNGTGNIIDTTYGERRFSYVSFANIKPIDKDEKYTLLNANKLRVEYVYAQHMETHKKYVKWPEMGRIFFDRMNHNYDKNEKDINKILAKINIKQYKTDEEKIFAIENYIKVNIASEPNAQEVETFAEILKLKYTYPFKINQMLFQLYRKAEINCELVLTCEKDYKRLDPEFDSWTYLKNVLFYFPSVSKFIDPQASLYRLGKIKSDFLDQNGLFVKLVSIGDVVSASASIRNIPANTPEATVDRENYTVLLDNDLTGVTVQYHREMNGYAEQGLKGAYFIMDESKRKTEFESFVKGLATDGVVSNLEVLNYDITNSAQYGLPLIINAKIKTAHYIETAGSDKAILKIGDLIGQQMEMYQTTPRVTPVDIPFAHNYQRTITINIPKGYKLSGLDKLNINHTYNNAAGKPSFGFVSTYTVKGDQLVVNCSEYYNDLTYPVAQFEHYKEVINDAADFNKISILIVKE